MNAPLKAPFPWFGGKLKVAPLVWAALGDVKNYVEPFFGSGAVFLNRPHPHRIATLNDADGFVANFWRAIAADPECVARQVDWPAFENDLHARHHWLIERENDLKERLEGNPDYYDPKIAAWWAWGICCWIGSGWCSGKGPWRVENGRLTKGDAGRGVHRNLLHLGDAGQGVHRKLLHLGDAGRGVQRPNVALVDWFQELAARLAVARVCCGDWTRVLGPSVTFRHGLTGLFLDPPYSHAMREKALYTIETDCSAEVRAWAIANGDNPMMRIVLAGYEGEYDELAALGWQVVPWKANGGYGNRCAKRGRENAKLERLFLSPHCLPV